MSGLPESPQHKPLRILCLHGYSGRNLGDAAIVEGMKKVIENRFGPCRWKMLSVEHGSDYRFDKNVSYFRNLGLSVIPALFPSPQFQRREGKIPSLSLQIIRFFRGWVYSRWCILMARIFKSKARYFIGPVARSTIDAMVEADIVMSKGGGYLYSEGMRGELFLRRMLSPYLLSKALNKPTIAFGVTVGPISGRRSRKLARRVLKKLDRLYVREELSMALLKELDADHNAKVIPDIAFGLASTHKPASPQEGVINIGVTARNWNFIGSEDPQVRKQNYINALARALDILATQNNARIHLIAHSTVDNIKEDDSRFFSLILERMKRVDSVKIMEVPDSVQALQDIYAKMHLVIGARMHSLILAAAMRVPMVGIACEKPKTHGIMRMLGQEEMVINVEDLRAEELVGKANHALQKREEYRRKIDANILKIIADLDEAANDIERFFLER